MINRIFRVTNSLYYEMPLTVMADWLPNSQPTPQAGLSTKFRPVNKVLKILFLFYSFILPYYQVAMRNCVCVDLHTRDDNATGTWPARRRNANYSANLYTKGYGPPWPVFSN